MLTRSAISPKPRLGRCKVCHVRFEKVRSIEPTCGKFDCKVEYGIQVARKSAEKRQKEAKRAKAASVKARKEAVKTRSEWLKEAQVAFNAFIRERDKHLPCICCGKFSDDADLLTGSRWDCGHYRSTGSAPHLRFDERNAHRQRVICNRNGAGRAVDYRIGLIARIGLEAVEALEADNTPRKLTVEDLKAIKAEYKAKLKQLQGAK